MSDWYPPSRPRPVDGGLKARSRRGAIGETWWSRHFIDLLESLRLGTRLDRGRRYARAGQVLDLEITPGVVRARVQGSRARPYKVRLDTPVLIGPVWEQIEQVMAERAAFAARLLAGEMPHDIDEAVAAAGVSLFPGDARELVSSCSCPDWSNPCKHVAAVYYLLAEAFDADPFLIFAWRGRSKDTILADLRALRGTTTAEDGAGSDHEDIGGRRDAARSVSPVAAAPLADCLDQFWSAGDLSGLRIRPRAARVPDALLRTLDPAPVDPVTKADPVTRDLGRRLAELLAPAYQTLTAAAAARALGGAPHDGDQGE